MVFFRRDLWYNRKKDREGTGMANKKLKLLYLARYLREELPKLV